MAITFGASLGTPVTDTAASGTTIAMTTNVVVPSNGRLIVVVSWYHATATASMGGGGLTWALDRQQNGTTDTARHLAVFSAHAPSGLASGTTLTATFSVTSFGRAIFGAYFEGLLDAAYEDVDQGARGTTAAWNTAANTTTNADDLIVGGCWFDGPVTSNTPDGTDTEALDFNNALDSSWCYEYRIVSSTGSYDLGGTWASATNEWLAAFVAYKSSAPSEPAPSFELLKQVGTPGHNPTLRGPGDSSRARLGFA